MKIQLIKTKDKFILVSDEKAKEGDIGYIPFEGGSIKTIGKYFADDWVKVISENPDFSDLKEKDCKTIGFVDVEKLAKQHRMNICKATGSSSIQNEISFIEGFKTAQSLNDKMFSLEDMRNAIQFGLDDMYGYRRGKDGHTEVQKDKYIQSLQQTAWDVEVEMEDCDLTDCKSTCSSKCIYPHLKITNGKIKVTKIL